MIEFDDELIVEMKPKDGKVALLVGIFTFFITSVTFLFIRYLWGRPDVDMVFWESEVAKFLVSIPFVLLGILVVIYVIGVRKQSLSTIGIKREKNIKSIFLGVLFGLPFVLIKLRIGFGNNLVLKDADTLFWLGIYYLINIALVEEIIFRGFIQTRIQGLVNGKWKSIWITGFLFAIMHFPNVLMNANAPILPVFFSFLPTIGEFMFYHLIHVYLYTRDQNILAPVVMHMLIDLSINLFI
ncbi:CPBP family intramembrane glutamic endopeptidase [Fusibacter bizertensis]